MDLQTVIKLLKSGPGKLHAPMNGQNVVVSPYWLKTPPGTPRVTGLPAGVGYENPVVTVPNEIPEKARKLGFDKTVYHSTTSPYEFDEFMIPRVHNFGIHAGTLAAASERGANTSSRGIIPLLMRSGNIIETRDHGGWFASDLARTLAKKHGWMDEPAIKEIMSRPNRVDNTSILRDFLDDKGINTIKYINAAEDAGNPSYIGLHPSQFRVPWANFDPSKSNSGNIYAGLAGGSFVLPQVIDWLKNGQQE